MNPLRPAIILLIILFIIIAITATPTASSAPTPAILEIGQLPGQRQPDTLLPSDRNPFARRETRTAAIVADKESEESLLRTVFAGMTVSGVIRGGSATKVLLGEFILKEGASLPALIPEQTEQLVVGPITDERIELQFVETNPQAEPRKIFIPIDLRPRVAVRTAAAPSSPAVEPPAPAQDSLP